MSTYSTKKSLMKNFISCAMKAEVAIRSWLALFFHLSLFLPMGFQAWLWRLKRIALHLYYNYLYHNYRLYYYCLHYCYLYYYYLFCYYLYYHLFYLSLHYLLFISLLLLLLWFEDFPEGWLLHDLVPQFSLGLHVLLSRSLIIWSFSFYSSLRKFISFLR